MPTPFQSRMKKITGSGLDEPDLVNVDTRSQDPPDEATPVASTGGLTEESSGFLNIPLLSPMEVPLAPAVQVFNPSDDGPPSAYHRIVEHIHPEDDDDDDDDDDSEFDGHEPDFSSVPMDGNSGIEDSFGNQSEGDLQFFDMISAFLTVNPNPSDDQFHALAASINMDHDAFEEKMFSLMSLMLENEEISDNARQVISSHFSG